MQPVRLQRALVLLLMSACFYPGQIRSEPGTGLEGVITIGPSHPGPIRADTPSSMPFADASFVVQGEKGVVASFTTDKQGQFQISLPPGHYIVALKGQKPAIGHFGPFEIDIVAGEIKKVQWECDAGTR